MAIAEDGRRSTRLAPLGDQHRAAADWVCDDLAGKAEPGKRWSDLVGEIGAQHRRALLDLAFRRDRDAAGEIGGKAALVEIGFGGGDGGGATHAVSRQMTSGLAGFADPMFSIITAAKIGVCGIGRET